MYITIQNKYCDLCCQTPNLCASKLDANQIVINVQSCEIWISLHVREHVNIPLQLIKLEYYSVLYETWLWTSHCFIVHALLLRLCIMRDIWGWQYVEFDTSSLQETRQGFSLFIKLHVNLMEQFYYRIAHCILYFPICSSKHQNVNNWF